jgi:hypothetical protein
MTTSDLGVGVGYHFLLLVGLFVDLFFFDPSVPVILVAQPEASGEASVKIVLPNWIRATPFLRAGYGCQHMKVCSIRLPLEPG